MFLEVSICQTGKGIKNPRMFQCFPDFGGELPVTNMWFSTPLEHIYRSSSWSVVSFSGPEISFQPTQREKKRFRPLPPVRRSHQNAIFKEQSLKKQRILYIYTYTYIYTHLIYIYTHLIYIYIHPKLTWNLEKETHFANWSILGGFMVLFHRSVVALQLLLKDRRQESKISWWFELNPFQKNVLMKKWSSSSFSPKSIWGRKWPLPKKPLRNHHLVLKISKSTLD